MSTSKQVAMPAAKTSLVGLRLVRLRPVGLNPVRSPLAQVNRVALTTACALSMLFVGLAGPASAQGESAGDGRVTRSTPASRAASSGRVATASTRPGGSGSRGSGSGGSNVGRGGGRNGSMGHDRGDRRGRGGYNNRHRRGGYRYGGSYGYGSYYRSPFFYYGLGYPFSWYVGSYASYGYAPYGHMAYGGGGYGGSYYRASAAALDLDISPEEAQIYVDGKLVGIADNYDGFPRYLWLDAGVHNLVIYHEGYETLGKQIKLEAGGSLRLKDKMVKGVAKSPEKMYEQLDPLPGRQAKAEKRTQLAPWRYDDRDAGEQGASGSEAVRRSRAPEGQASPRSRDQWRQRGSSSRAASSVEVDLRSEPAKVVFAIQPEDAAIYVDGQLVGGAAQLADLGAPLMLDAGDHVVEISRPGYQGHRVEFTIKSGETETVKIDLVKSP